MRGLRSVAWRNLTRRKTRYALTALGIVLGVANVFAVLITNASTNNVFKEGSQIFAGGADAVAYRDDAQRPLMPDEITALQRAPDVRTASVIWQGFDSIKKRGRTAFLGAIDDVGRREFVRNRLRKGRLVRAGRPEAVISRRTAEVLGLKIGDVWTTDLSRFRKGVRWDETGDVVLRLRPGAPDHLRLRITGIVSDPGEGRGDFIGGSSTSLEYAWKVLQPSVATEVRFYLKKDADANRWVDEMSNRFPSVRFRTVGVNTDFRRFLYVLQGAMSGAAAIAVFVGAFLIYLTFSMSVIERTRLLGTLHAIGASSAQVTRSILGEAVMLGTIATAAGLGFGLLAARALLPLMARVVGTATPALVVTPGAVVAGVGVGVFATLAGSLVPARRAGRLSPIESIRGDHTLATGSSRVWIVGAALVVASTASSIASRGIEAPSVYAQIGTLALLLGSVLLLPPLLGPLARAARSVFHRHRGGLGDVAVMHLVRERSHSAYTLGLVMVVLAMMLALAAANGSVGHAGEVWVDKRFGADLIAYRQGIVPGTEDKLAEVDGVSGVTWAAYEASHISRPASTGINVVIIDPASFFRVAGFPWAEGEDAAAQRALKRGGRVLLPAPTATKMLLRLGDRVTFDTRKGPREFVLAGTYASFGGGPEIGAVVGARDASFFHVGPLNRNVLYINFTTRASIAETRAAVDDALVAKRPANTRAQFGPNGGVGRSGYFFITGAQIKAEAHRQLRSYFALFYAVLLVAVLVGLLGLANTMAMGVIRRFREIGIVQAVGAAPRAVARMIRSETTLMVSVAFLLSIALGTLVAWLIVQGAGSILGFPIDFIFPWRWVPTLAILASVIALASAASPARRAARLTPIQALRYE